MTHLLKSLELNGYKTFATSTEFEFAERVTAIVGPNGSGKSNIADALRWVLGEQSYSLLRGRKTEDMIFSGSEQRSRAGMASATVLFDNTSGWLPIDYSEVSISRRAYRDGQNEYLINGQRVRLRDVSELLAKSGLAERTYTIIGQGLVDAALALRADERRRLFEEAAGIGLYRSRREEALRRLDSTRRNLDRVKDIMAELRPRLRSLERQATRAREHEQIKEDLRQILLEWYGFHWHRSQKELVEARQAARRHQITLDESRRKQESLDEELAGYRTQILALRTELNEWHHTSAELHSKRELLSREMAVGEERLRSMLRQRQELTTSLEQVEAEISFDQARLAEAEKTISGYALELEEAREQQQRAGQALTSQQEKRHKIESELLDVQQSLAEMTARQSTLTERMAELEARLNRQQDQQSGLHQAVQQAGQTLANSEQEQRRLQTEHEESREAHQQAVRALEAAEAEARLQEESRRQLAISLAERQAEAARLQARLDVLNQAERTLMGYAEGVRLLLKAAREARLPGLRGSLRDHLDVPAEWETAIAAALGDYLEAVLLDTGGQADQALATLQEGKRGAMLLPLDQLRPLSPLSPPNDPDCAGLAVDLITTRPELDSALNLLLGQVLLVTDRQAARRLISGFPPGAKAVTKAGEVFHAEGPISAHGQLESGGLSRQRQKREIQESLTQLSAEIEDLQTGLENADQGLLAIRQSVEDRAAALRGAQEAAEVARAAAQQADLALESERYQAGWNQEQMHALLEEQGRTQAEIQETQAALERLEIEIGTMQGSLAEHRQALSELPLDDFRTQANHWELQVAVAGQVANQARERFQDQRASLERQERRREEILARLTTLSQNIEEQEARQISLRQEESAVTEEIRVLAEKIEPAETELQKAERSLEGYRGQEIQARQAVGQAERYSTQSQIALARQQESLETLRYRIEDDFGLVEFSYDDSVSGPTPLPLEGMVEQLPIVTELSDDIEDSLKRKRAHLRRIGAINPEAQKEYEEVRERFEFLTSQLNDLEAAETHVVAVIDELDGLMEREFLTTFEAVAKEFRDIFTRLFAGGSARLILTDPDDMTGTGIDIDARLPGRRTQGLSLLSGGERSLTATALVFALLRVSPTPFCVLDEVDAMLDEANVGRFRELLQELSQETQFILITHNRGTVQVADVIYGVTMGRDSVSQVLSLKIDQVADVVPG